MHYFYIDFIIKLHINPCLAFFVAIDTYCITHWLSKIPTEKLCRYPNFSLDFKP